MKLADVLVLLVVALGAAAIAYTVFRKREAWVPKAGMSVQADLRTMRSHPRVTVGAVEMAADHGVRIAFDPAGEGEPFEVVVRLDPGEFGYQQLLDWCDARTELAIVFPGRRLVRLRSLEELQPLTLRRLD